MASKFTFNQKFSWDLPAPAAPQVSTYVGPEASGVSNGSYKQYLLDFEEYRKTLHQVKFDEHHTKVAQRALEKKQVLAAIPSQIVGHTTHDVVDVRTGETGLPHGTQSPTTFNVYSKDRTPDKPEVTKDPLALAKKELRKSKKNFKVKQLETLAKAVEQKAQTTSDTPAVLFNARTNLRSEVAEKTYATTETAAQAIVAAKLEKVKAKVNALTAQRARAVKPHAGHVITKFGTNDSFPALDIIDAGPQTDVLVSGGKLFHVSSTAKGTRGHNRITALDNRNLSLSVAHHGEGAGQRFPDQGTVVTT